jgi:hypothetical protein
VYGPPGVGKTWTSLDYPNAYYIDVEGGANLPHYTAKLDQVGAMYMGPEDGAADFETVLQEVVTLATTQHDRKTLIIDSFSKLFNNDVQVEHDRLIAAGKEAAYGMEKKSAVAKTRRLVKWLSKLDMNVILVCHEKPRWQDGEQVGFEADAHSELTYDLNLVVRIVKQGKSRKAKVAKTRFDTFAEGELVDWTYEEFASRLGRQQMEAEFCATEMATPEQVEKMVRLCREVPIPQTICKTIWERCGVGSWEQMTAEEMFKAITFYTAKLQEGLRSEI